MSTKNEQRRRRETLRPHAVRDQILDAMVAYGRALSPTQLQRVLSDLTLGTVAYHMRVLASAGLIDLTDETRVRGAIEHYYTVNFELAKEFIDPVARLQALCGQLMVVDEATGLPKAVTLDEETRKKLLELLLNEVQPRVAEIIAEQPRR